MHLLFSGQYLTTCLTSSIKIYLRISKFFKVYVIPLKGQKRPFSAFPRFRWHSSSHGHNPHCPIEKGIIGTPIFTLSKALFPARAKNGLRNRKGVAASDLGLSSPLDLCRGEWLSSQTRGTASAATPTVPMWGTSPEIAHLKFAPR